MTTTVDGDLAVDRSTWLHRLGLAGFALLVYVPILLTSPGRVVADTKSYPYLDPDRFIGRIASVWDPNIGLGTVTHQNIGYLFPLGPFYWLTHGVLGLPAWVAQRLWLGTLILGAGLGMRYLMRTLAIRGPGVPVAMLAYALSPYATEFSARLSVLLGPWAALPWLVGFTIRALREPRGWKYPSLFALTVLLVGAVNATALLYALIGPAAWVAYAIWVRHEVTFREAWRATWRTGALTALTSLWWVVGLAIEGRFGMGILRFTESVEVVSHTSTATEVLRGLGYWFFYGGDLRGQWNDAVLDFTRRPWLIAVSFLIPALALLATSVVRWKHRAFFVGMIVLGTVIAVAASPYDDPAPLGSVFKAFATSSTAGFALRSTARAVPLLVMGLAVLLGVGISAAWTALEANRRGWVAVAAASVVGVLCVVNAPGLWNGRYYSRYLERDEEVPAYWTEALSALDARGTDTRVLALPGADFASYRWGDTIDPIEPGLMDRPYVARELVPWGGEATTNLLIALDGRVQDRLLEPAAVAPVARLMGVGDILFRLDLQTDQFNLVSARDLWEDFVLDGLPPDIGAPTVFGAEIPGELLGSDFGDPAEPPVAEPKPVAVLPVEDAVPIVRAKGAADPVVIDGDGEGIVDAAGAGLLDGRRLVVSSPEYNGEPGELRDRVEPRALLIVTDSNRRRGMRWAGMRNNYGYTEVAGEKPLRQDLLDQRLDIYPDVTDAARTVTELRGVKAVRATTFGTPAFGYSPQSRPALALDGDRRSAWEVAAGETKVGKERIHIELEQPVTADHVGLVQASHGARGRWITDVSVRLDGGAKIHSEIARRGDSDVRFPMQTFSTIDVQIERTDANKIQAVATEAGRRRKTGVGFEEIIIRDRAPGSKRVLAREVTRMPVDMLRALGASSADHPLALLMTSPADAGMWRRVEIPTAREFGVSGTSFLNAAARDDAIDAVLGLPGLDEGGIQVTSSERLANLKARASSAFDGDPTTAWNSRARDLEGEWVRLRTPAPVTVDELNLALLDDGRHSVPTRLRIENEEGESRVVDVPATPAVDGIANVKVAVPPITGQDLTFTLDAVRVVTIRGANRAPITMPVGIVEMGVPGVQRAALPTELPDRCIDDQLRVDGEWFPVRVGGTTADALEGRPLPIEPCAPDQILAWTEGSHEVRARARRQRGLVMSQFVLSSAAGGAASTPSAVAATPESTPPSTPTVELRNEGRSSFDAQVRGATAPFWLVLGQSHNAGWHASIDGTDLGPPDLVDGYANGWRIDPAEFGANPTVSVSWTPQRFVWIALAVSAVATLACLAILVVAFRRRRARPASAPATDEPWLESPFAPSPSAPVGTAVVAGLVAGLLAAVVVGPMLGFAAAIFTAASLRWRGARGLVRLLPAVILLVIGAYVTSGQIRHNYPPNFEWPLFFDRARNFAWLAVILTAINVAVTQLLARRSREAG